MFQKIHSIDNFPYKEIHGVTYRKHKITYYNITAAFDIETTSIYCKKRENCAYIKCGKNCQKEKCKNYIEPYAFMYIWQICINSYLCIGRTWEEYKTFITRISEALELSEYKRLVIYVHNLSFEFQFLQAHFYFTEIFAREKRKPIKAVSGGIEYRCSYILTNMSLEKAVENEEGTIYRKKSGDLDYSVIRTPKTILTEKEVLYCIYDVLSLEDVIRRRLINYNDNITTIPLTSTGYVRRDFKKAYQSNPSNKKMQRQDKLSPEVYKLLKEEFRGGNTHANYLYVNSEIKNVDSYDIASSYPYVMMVKKFPRKFIKGKEEKLNTYIKKGYACIFRAYLYDVEFKANHNIPYIPISKCVNISLDRINDNGRILKASYLSITLNDIDYKLILDQYNFKIKIFDLYIAKYDYLPKEGRECILNYFKLKCELKDVEGKEYEYMKSKNKLNSTYGMMVTDICSPEIIYDKEWKENAEINIEEKLDAYYKSNSTFLSYQTGIWVTSYARQRHYEGISLLGENTIYGDTDSVKGINIDKTLFEELNRKVYKEIENLDIKPQVVVNGKIYTMGIWEHDAHYKRFKTLGAKKYIVEKEDGEIEITVAGLSKKVGAKEIKDKGFKEFKIGKVFYPSGRLNVTYNDDSEHEIEFNGEKILTGSNLALYPASYKLGITEEYRNLLLTI